MALLRRAEGLCLCCDACGEELDSDFSPDGFLDMIAYAKMQRWVIRKVDHEYEHYCERACAPGGSKDQKALLGL